MNGALNVLHARIVAALQSAERAQVSVDTLVRHAQHNVPTAVERVEALAGEIGSLVAQLRKASNCAEQQVSADTAAHNRRFTDAGSSEHLPHGRTIIAGSQPARRADDKVALTFERAASIAPGGLHSSRGIVDYLTSRELARHPLAGQTVHRFADVRCAQCQQSFGPGNVGFSRCYEHEAAKRREPRVEASMMARGTA